MVYNRSCVCLYDLFQSSLGVGFKLLCTPFAHVIADSYKKGAGQGVARHCMSEMYVCSLCNRSFSTQRSLKCHRESVHRQSAGFSCQVCGKRFYRKDWPPTPKMAANKTSRKCNFTTLLTPLNPWMAIKARHLLVRKHCDNDHVGAVPEDLLSCFKVLKKCMNKFDCLVNEMLYIKQLTPSLNVQTDSIRAKVFV